MALTPEQARAMLAERGIDWQTGQPFQQAAQPQTRPPLDKETARRMLAERGIDWQTGRPIQKQEQGIVGKGLNALDSVGRPIADYAIGSLQGAANIAGMLSPGQIPNIINKVAKNYVPKPLLDALANNVPGLPGTKYKEMSPHFAPNTAAAKYGETAGEIGSSFLLPELQVAKGIQAIPLATKGVSNLVKAIANFAKSTAGAGAEGGAWTALNNITSKDTDISKNVGQNSLVSAIANTLLRGGAAGVNALTTNRINNMVQNLASHASPGGIRSPEEAAKAYEQIKPILGDAKMDLGSLVGDMPLSVAYNQKLKASAGSGPMVINNQYKRLANANRETNSVLQDMLGNSTDRNVHSEIINRINNLKEANTQASRKEFNSIVQEANERGFSFPGWSKAAQYAKETLEKESRVLGSGIKGELRTTLKNLAEPANSATPNQYKWDANNPADRIISEVPINGKQAKNNNQPQYSYEDAHFSHSNIGKMGDQYAAKQEYRAADVSNTLQEKIREDIEDALRKTGNQDLFDRWKVARENFKNNVVPFRKKSLTSILSEDKNANKISDELLLDRNKDVMRHVDQDTRNLMGYAQFSDLMKETGHNNQSASLQNIMNRYQTLKRSGDLDIISPELQKRLDAINTFNTMLPESKLAMNPGGTGIRNYATLTNAIKAAIPTAAYLGHFPGFALGGAVAIPAYENAKARALTSDWLRNAYINQGVNPLVRPQKTTDLTNALIRAFAQQNSGDKK